MKKRNVLHIIYQNVLCSLQPGARSQDLRHIPQNPLPCLPTRTSGNCQNGKEDDKLLKSRNENVHEN